MRALVTGGGGFVGAALVRELRARGDSVRVLARGDYPALRALGAETMRGDVREPAAVDSACRAMDVVFHTAALAAGAGPREEFESINVQGTRNVIASCRRGRVRALVYTSSPSVVFAGHDIEGGDESLPYASRYLAHYPRTKAIAEREVRAAAGDSLPTIALRPHLVWGPGDRHLLPRLLARARTGRLRRIGARDPLIDMTYIDNCSAAHLCAADALLAGGSRRGAVYFVSDGEPVGLWSMAERMLRAAGAPPPGKAVPRRLAYAVAALLEAAYVVFRKRGEPLLTRFAVSQLSHAQWFDIGAARRDLGYRPRTTVDEGLAQLQLSLEGQRP